MAVLEGINRKHSSGSGTFLGRQQLLLHDLQTATHQLTFTPYNLALAAERSKRTYNFVASQTAPLLLDEQLKFPISLPSALQTAALYQIMNWAQPVTRRYIAAEFFRKYCTLLIKEAVKLAVTRQVGFDLSANNLAIAVLRGEPTGIQFRRFGGVVGPAFPQPGQGANFEFAATTAEFYRPFVHSLLQENLKPLVAKLIEVSGAKAEVFWDYAIEVMLETLAELQLEPEALEQTRQWLLIEELDPGDRLLTPTQSPSCSTTSPFANGGVLYLKRRCCEKFKQKTRCSNCPGLRRM